MSNNLISILLGFVVGILLTLAIASEDMKDVIIYYTLALVAHIANIGGIIADSIEKKVV